jgi:hypothetical protein
MGKPATPPGFDQRPDRDPPGFQHANENAVENSKLFEHLDQIEFTTVTVPFRHTDVDGDGVADNLGFDLNSGTFKLVHDPATDFAFFGVNSQATPTMRFLLGLQQYDVLAGQEVLELTEEILANHGDWALTGAGNRHPGSGDTILLKTDEGQIFAIGDVQFVDLPGTINDSVTLTYANVTEFFP